MDSESEKVGALPTRAANFMNLILGKEYSSFKKDNEIIQIFLDSKNQPYEKNLKGMIIKIDWMRVRWILDHYQNVA